MRTWKLPPLNPSHEQLIECYWYCEKEVGDDSEPFPKLYPAHCSCLIITDAKHSYENEQAVTSTNGSHWLYPYLSTYTLDHSSPFRLIGIKFKVGALYSLPVPFSKNDLNTIKTSGVTELLNIDQSYVDDLLNSAFAEPGTVQRQLDTLLEPLINQSKQDKHSQLVERVMDVLRDTAIKDIGRQLFATQRTIERSFSRVTNLTMKQCQTILRFEQILEYLHQKDISQINWVEFANEFDFSDQPHLIRSIKQAIGRTPGEYALQRDLTIDVYGDFEFD